MLRISLAAGAAALLTILVACSSSNTDNSAVQDGGIPLADSATTPAEDAAAPDDAGSTSRAQCPGEPGGCARASIDTTLACAYKVTPGGAWSTSVKLTPEETRGFCRIRREGADIDLESQALPPEGQSERRDQLYLRIRKFTGPGVYTLKDEEDIGDANTGITISGKGSEQDPNASFTTRAGSCTQGCKATVTGGALPDAGGYAEYVVEVDCSTGLNDFIEPACSAGIECTMANPKFRVDLGCTF